MRTFPILLTAIAAFCRVEAAPIFAAEALFGGIMCDGIIPSFLVPFVCQSFLEEDVIDEEEQFERDQTAPMAQTGGNGIYVPPTSAVTEGNDKNNKENNASSNGSISPTTTKAPTSTKSPSAQVPSSGSASGSGGEEPTPPSQTPADSISNPQSQAPVNAPAEAPVVYPEEMVVEEELESGIVDQNGKPKNPKAEKEHKKKNSKGMKEDDEDNDDEDTDDGKHEISTFNPSVTTSEARQEYSANNALVVLPKPDPTGYPTESHTDPPTVSSTSIITISLTSVLTSNPTGSQNDPPTGSTTESPTGSPTGRPTSTSTSSPTASPTGAQTEPPASSISNSQSQAPAKAPVVYPEEMVVEEELESGIVDQNGKPTVSPTSALTSSPTSHTTGSPTDPLTGSTTDSLTGAPSSTVRPTTPLTSIPTASRSPTEFLTGSPSESPTRSHTGSPTGNPTSTPTASPTSTPNINPASSPTGSTTPPSEMEVDSEAESGTPVKIPKETAPTHNAPAEPAPGGDVVKEEREIEPDDDPSTPIDNESVERVETPRESPSEPEKPSEGIAEPSNVVIDMEPDTDGDASELDEGTLGTPESSAKEPVEVIEDLETPGLAVGSGKPVHEFDEGVKDGLEVPMDLNIPGPAIDNGEVVHAHDEVVDGPAPPQPKESANKEGNGKGAPSAVVTDGAGPKGLKLIDRENTGGEESKAPPAPKKDGAVGPSDGPKVGPLGQGKGGRRRTMYVRGQKPSQKR